MLKRKWQMVAVAAGAVLVAAGCNGPADDGDAPAEQAAAAEQGGETGPGSGPGGDDSAGGDPAQGGAEGPDLDSIPDPVAEVNGTSISKDEFVTVFEGQYQQMAMQAQMSGQPVDEEQLKQQSVEGLVGTELLEQEAADRGLGASESEIDAELEEFAETNQVSTDEFVAKMGEQGMDSEEVMEQIESQLVVEKLITEEYGEFTPSEEEVQSAYDQAGQQQSMMGAQGGGQELPPLEEVRGDVEEQLKSEKQAQDMQTLFEELREDADITVNL